MSLAVETEQEIDGRWLAEVRAVPGALAYRATRTEAIGPAQGVGAPSDRGQIEER